VREIENGDAAREEESDFLAFLSTHEAQLKSLGVPERLWKRVFEKVQSETFDAGQYFQVLYKEPDEDDKENPQGGYRVVLTQDLSKDSEVFLIDHAWSTTWRTARQQLKEIPGLVKRLVTIMDMPLAPAETPSDNEVDAVWLEMWRYLCTYRMTTLQGDFAPDAIWYMMDEVGSWIRHNDDPSFETGPFFDSIHNVAYNLLWPIQDVTEGDEVTRDYCPHVKEVGRRAARLFPWLESSGRWANPSDIEKYQAAIGEAFSMMGNKNKEEGGNAPPRPQAITLGPPLPNISLKSKEEETRKLRIFTDVDTARENLRAPEFEFVDEDGKADILWLVANIVDWASVPSNQLVNQFPGEGCLVEKQNLPVTLNDFFKGEQNGWLPRTFNMETQLPELIATFVLRQAESFDNHWIIKPWRMARSMDMCIADHLLCMIRMAESGPKIASKYIDRPALFKGCKFDLRYVVLLRRTDPLDLLVYNTFIVRSAEKPFALNDLEDFEKHFTAMNYKPTPGPVAFTTHTEFIKEFEQQQGKPWKETEQRIFESIRKPFEAAIATKIPPFPTGRAIYGMDVILDVDLHPFLLEVTYMPDNTKIMFESPQVWDHIFSALFLDKVDPTHLSRI